jgi:hypothetical protein
MNLRLYLITNVINVKKIPREKRSCGLIENLHIFT